MTTRSSHMEKERAVGAARNPGDSKYGNALYRSSAVTNRAQSAELLRIEKQLKRTSMHIDQEKKQFLQRHSQKEPILIVVRPASPSPIINYEERQYNIENDLDYGHPRYKGGPRYMEPLGSKDKIPNYRPTIDAFCVQTKKKVNVWEHVLLDKETPKFRSTIQPSYPLSRTEHRDLVRGLEYHKLELEAANKERLQGEKKKKKKRKKTQRALPSATTGSALPEASRFNNDVYDPQDSSDRQWQFVTEASPQSILGNEQEGETRRGSGAVRFKLPDLTPRTLVSEDAGSSRSSSRTPPDSLDDVPQQSPKRRPRSNEQIDKDSKPMGWSKQGTIKSKSKSLKPKKTSDQEIPPKTTAICVVHGETSAQSAENIHTTVTPPEVTTVTGPDNAKTDMTNAERDDGDENLDPNRSQVVTPQRKQSGLSVILEAAMEGMGDTSPRQ